MHILKCSFNKVQQLSNSSDEEYQDVEKSGIYNTGRK